MISLRVNGRDLELEEPTPLLAYLDRLGVNRKAVAVELNGRILERSEYDAAVLGAGDVVEIVRMVGGGGSPARPILESGDGQEEGDRAADRREPPPARRGARHPTS